MKDFHQLQILILQKLLYSDGLRYSQLKPHSIEGSQFTFHLDQLTKLKFVYKLNNLYKLTPTGKELANRMDLGDEKIETQAKVSVLMVCVKNDNVLLYTRLKSPFFGYQGFPTGKVKNGEDILKAAKRELLEETGLKGTPKLFAIRHYKIYDLKKNLLEDKIFFACKFVDPVGILKNNPEGKYRWVRTDKIWEYLKKPVEEVKEIFDSLENEELTFLEKEYSTEGF